MLLADLHQTTTPATALTGFLARLLDPAGAPGEGVFYGGATAVGDLPSGTSYPAFLALVNDDLGQTWPLGDVNPSAITFVDTAGACTLYLSPFSTSELPTAQAGRLGAFTLIAQLTASDPPSDCLALGSGTARRTAARADAGAVPGPL